MCDVGQAESAGVFGDASPELFERASLADHWSAAGEFFGRPENDC